MPGIYGTVTPPRERFYVTEYGNSRGHGFQVRDRKRGDTGKPDRVCICDNEADADLVRSALKYLEHMQPV